MFAENLTLLTDPYLSSYRNTTGAISHCRGLYIQCLHHRH
ncbi:hypothetical protein DSUL_30076 [Desulfovibrionales bacterium]